MEKYFDPIKFGKRVKDARELKNMTQQDLADAVGYTKYQSIQEIEKGKKACSIDRLVDFANALNTTTDYLLGIEKNISKEKEILDGILSSKSSTEIMFLIKLAEATFENKELLIYTPN